MKTRTKILITVIAGIIVAVTFAVSVPTDVEPHFDPHDSEFIPGADPGILLQDYGKSVTEQDISQRVSFEVAKIQDMSQAKIGNNKLVLLDIKMRSENYVYYLYGSPDMYMNDTSAITDFVTNGGVVVRTAKLSQESPFSEFAKNFRDDASKVYGTITYFTTDENENTRADFYPNDGRHITVNARATESEIAQFGSMLDFEN